jgi:hypothetical protein
MALLITHSCANASRAKVPIQTVFIDELRNALRFPPPDTGQAAEPGTSQHNCGA